MNTRYIYENIVGEIDAINLYNKAIKEAEESYERAILESIRDEEKVHLGELFYLLSKTDPKQAKALTDGFKEVKEIVRDTKFECMRRHRNIKRRFQD